MIFYVLVHLLCRLWGIGTDFDHVFRCAFAFMSFAETVVEGVAVSTIVVNWWGNRGK